VNGIEIACKAPSHEGRVAVVRRFHYWANLGWGAEVIKAPRPRYGYAGQALDSDSRPISGRHAALNGVDRVRYRLECNLCKDTVPVREEKLYAVFDKLRDHLPETGYFTITLDMLRRALAANL
jgi:hypothetical protein